MSLSTRPSLFLSLAACAALTSCGSQNTDPMEPVQIVLPWKGPSTQCNPEAFGGMQVELLVSGEQEPCQLDVQDDLGVEGTCHNIQRGLVRYILFSYRIPSSDGKLLVDLAHLISYVDLTPEALGDATTINVDLVNNGTSGLLIYSSEDIQDLPVNYDVARDSPMEQAKGWARDILLANSVNLDFDEDNCPNLWEACTNTIFVNEFQSCNN